MNDTRGGAALQEPPTWLTPKDLMRELQISERFAYRLLNDGVIPSVWIGGVRRIYRPHLEAALLGNTELGEEA